MNKVKAVFITVFYSTIFLTTQVNASPDVPQLENIYFEAGYKSVGEALK